MTRLNILALAALLASLAFPASAAQVTPSFGLDSTGVMRNLSVKDPTISGSSDAARTPLGALDTTTHLFTPATMLATVSAAAAYHPNFPPDYIRTQGYSVVGTGGALYQKVASQPTHSFKFSITDAGGATIWYGIADSERPVNPEMLGAIGGDGGDDTTAVQAALTSALNPLTGLGKSYRINGSVFPRDDLILQDITLVQTGTGVTQTLTNDSGGGTGPFTLRRVKIDYTAVPKTDGIAENANGLRLRFAHDIDIDGLEVTGNGKGTAVYIFTATNVKVHHLWVHDIEWSAAIDPGSEQIIGFYCHTCTDLRMDDFTVEGLWGTVPWVASTSLAPTQGYPWRTNAGKSYRATTNVGTTGTTPPTCTSGTCSDGTITWKYMGAYPAVRRPYQADGVDITNVLRGSLSNGTVRQAWEGFDAVGATNSYLYLHNMTYADIDGWAEKWGHCVFSGGSIGSRATNSGIAGFVVVAGGSSDSCGPTHIRIIDALSMNAGYNGNWTTLQTIAGYRVLNGPKLPSDVRIINSIAADDQAVHTMDWGFAAEVDDPNVVMLINPVSTGHTAGPYANFTGGLNFAPPTVPVEAYGAKGDSNGTTGNGADDTAAIQACVTTGRVCSLRPGATYRITSNISIPSNGGLAGRPDRSAIIYMDPAGFNNTGNVAGYSPGQRYGATSQAFFIVGQRTTPFTPITNVVLRDFIIDGGGTTGGRCCQMIWINNAINITVSGLELKNWTTYGIRASTVRAMRLTGNNIHDFSNDTGIEYSGIQLDDDKFGVNGCTVDPDGLTVAGESCDVEISGNRISKMLVSETGYLNTFTDPILTDGYQANGIKVNGGNHILVTDNIIDHTGQNIDAYTINSIFSNNDLSYGLGFCIAMKHRNVSNLIIGNHASYCGVAGIALGGDDLATSYGTTIADNVIRNVGESAWLGFVSGLHVPLAGTTPYCIGWVTSTGNTVDGNTCLPGANGQYAWAPLSTAGSTSFWGRNAATPGTLGLWAPGIVEDSRFATSSVDAFRPWFTLASATAVDLDAAYGNLLNITGAVTIADFIDGQKGQYFKAKFAGALLLRCVGGMLICPGGANIVTAAGDIMEFIVDTPYPTAGGSGIYRVLSYTRANGKAIISPACADITDKTTAGCTLLTAADAAAQRTALGLTTGTSGHTIPYLDTANTWSLAQTFTVAPVFSNQSGSRTALGLGTAAVANTGTSGATVPLLDASNTFSQRTFFTGNPAITAMFSDNTSAANQIECRHTRSTPTNGDELCHLQFSGSDSVATNNNYAGIRGVATNVANGAETGTLGFETLLTGSNTTRMKIGPGVIVGAPTGGDKGAGTLNAEALWNNGTALGTAASAATGASGHTVPYLDVANTASARQTLSISSSGAETTPLALTNPNAAASTGVSIDFAPNAAGFGVRSAQIASTTVSGSQANLIFRTADGAAPNVVMTLAGSQGSVATGGVMVGPSGMTDPGIGVVRTSVGVIVGIVAVASLPACNAANEGKMMGVNNSNTVVYNATVAAGGSNHVPVYCNGTNWVLH